MRKLPLMICLLTTTCFLSACGVNKNTVNSGDASGIAPMDYKYTEETKTRLCFSDDKENFIDVTDDVSNYSYGDLFLTLNGMEKVFGLKEGTVTDEEKRLFEQYETEQNFDSNTGEIIKIENEDHVFVFRNGSNLYLNDGELKTFSYPPITDEESNISLPLFDIAFGLGYESIGTSVGENNQLTYIIYTSTSPNEMMGPAAGSETETETNVDETINESTENTEAMSEAESTDGFIDESSETDETVAETETSLGTENTTENETEAAIEENVETVPETETSAEAEIVEETEIETTTN